MLIELLSGRDGSPQGTSGHQRSPRRPDSPLEPLRAHQACLVEASTDRVATRFGYCENAVAGQLARADDHFCRSTDFTGNWFAGQGWLS